MKYLGIDLHKRFLVAAAEVAPIREVDRRSVGRSSRGPITRSLQAAFFDVVAGRDRKHEAWLTYL
jgi:branched-chain amino acid aminotransferase